MWKRIGCGIVAAAGALLMLPHAGANKNFVPDWTFQGSSLGSAHMLGGADWRADLTVLDRMIQETGPRKPQRRHHARGREDAERL